MFVTSVAFVCVPRKDEKSNTPITYAQSPAIKHLLLEAETRSKKLQVKFPFCVVCFYFFKKIITHEFNKNK